MASLWDNLMGRARLAPPPRSAAALPRAAPGGPPRRYLAVVARERPDLLARVNRLFGADGNVEAILDRRHGDRRRAADRPPGARAVADRLVEERRRADRREPRPATDLAAGLVVIAEASASAVPVRLARWLAEGRDVLGALDRVVDDLAALERRCAALRATIHRLQAENQALRARDAALSRELACLADEIARPLGEIVHRLRSG